MRTETATPECIGPFAQFSAVDSMGNVGAEASHADARGRGARCGLGAGPAVSGEFASELTPDSFERPSVGFIGAGALGSTLAVALSSVGWKVDAVASRSLSSARRLAGLIPGCAAVGHPQAVADGCRLIFITVPDDAIAEVASSIKWPEGRGVVHCCGAAGADLLSPALADGALCGSIHPLQTFASVPEGVDGAGKLSVALQRMEGITFTVEAPGWLRQALESMALDLRGKTIEIKPEDRALYHASAVMSCGAIVALLRSAAELWERMGIDQKTAFEALLPLARTTLENAGALGPEAATTGPVNRGDVATVGTHLESLQSRAPEALPLYVEITRALTAQSNILEGGKRGELGRLLSEYDRGASEPVKEPLAPGQSHNEGGTTHG